MSLEQAQANGLRASQSRTRAEVRQECAVLVALEFTAERRRLTSAARLARDAAQVQSAVAEAICLVASSTGRS